MSGPKIQVVLTREELEAIYLTDSRTQFEVFLAGLIEHIERKPDLDRRQILDLLAALRKRAALRQGEAEKP